MNLTELANKYGSDKGDKHFEAHNYTPVYESIINRNNMLPSLFLEIGINDPRFPGASVHMWKEYFKGTKWEYVGFDIVDRKDLEDLNNKVHIFTGDQGNALDLYNLANKFIEFDTILDDGSHFHYHQMMSFFCLYPYLRKGGYYIIEDLHGHDGWKTREWFKLYNSLYSFELFNNEKLLIIKK